MGNTERLADQYFLIFFLAYVPAVPLYIESVGSSPGEASESTKSVHHFLGHKRNRGRIRNERVNAQLG